MKSKLFCKLWIHFALICFLISCSKKEKTDPLTIIDRLSVNDLDTLKGILIKPRGEVYRFTVQTKEENYVLPFYETYKRKNEITDTAYFDVLKFAAIRGIDSANANSYVEQFSNEVFEIYKRSGAYIINSKPDIGDFIIFKFIPEMELIYKKENAEVLHPYWIDYFKNARPIKKEWYLYKSNFEKKVKSSEDKI